MVRFIVHIESQPLRKYLSRTQMNFMYIGIKFYNDASISRKRLSGNYNIVSRNTNVLLQLISLIEVLIM